MHKLTKEQVLVQYCYECPLMIKKVKLPYSEFRYDDSIGYCKKLEKLIDISLSVPNDCPNKGDSVVYMINWTDE